MKLKRRNVFHGFQGLAIIAFAMACDRIVDPSLPNNATAFVPPEVGIEFLPNPPASSVDGGVFTLVVSAHNSADHPVLVSLVSPSGSVAPPRFPTQSISTSIS